MSDRLILFIHVYVYVQGMYLVLFFWYNLNMTITLATAKTQISTIAGTVIAATKTFTSFSITNISVQLR